MNTVQLEGFKDGLLKEAGKLNTAKEIIKRNVKEVVNKGKDSAADARLGYHDGRAGIKTMMNSKSGQSGEFVGKHRNKILAGGGTVGVGGGAYALGKD